MQVCMFLPVQWRILFKHKTVWGNIAVGDDDKLKPFTFELSLNLAPNSSASKSLYILKTKFLSTAQGFLLSGRIHLYQFS